MPHREKVPHLLRPKSTLIAPPWAVVKQSSQKALYNETQMKCTELDTDRLPRRGRTLSWRRSSLAKAFRAWSLVLHFGAPIIGKGFGDAQARSVKDTMSKLRVLGEWHSSRGQAHLCACQHAGQAEKGKPGQRMLPKS